MATNYSPNIVTDGLTLAVDAKDKKCYPVSGSNITNMATGTTNGFMDGATFSSSSLGDSWDFDGTDDVIQFADMPGNSSEHTAEVWVNHDSTSNNNILFNTNGQGLYPRIMLISNVVRAQYNNGSTRLINGTTISTGVWNCFVFTYNTNTGGKLYVDGVEVGSDSNTGALSTSQGFSLALGRDTNLSRFLDGKIANVKIYNKELPAKQVLSNYNALKTRFS